VVSGLDPVFRQLFDGLSGRQRDLLLHLARHGSENLFAEEVRREHGLGSSSTLSSALYALLTRDVLEKPAGRGSLSIRQPRDEAVVE
jgi:hypothetical protein